MTLAPPRPTSRPAAAVPLPALLLLAGPLFAAPVGAEPWSVGASVPALSLADQHGAVREIDASVRFVLFSRDMDGGGVIKEALAKDGAAFLERNRAVYVADVSRMPGLIRSLMAKPAMRRRGYPMLLDEDGAPTADFPAEKGRATVVSLEALRVKRIEFVDSAAALRAAVEPDAAADEGDG